MILELIISLLAISVGITALAVRNRGTILRTSTTPNSFQLEVDVTDNLYVKLYYRTILGLKRRSGTVTVTCNDSEIVIVPTNPLTTHTSPAVFSVKGTSDISSTLFVSGTSRNGSDQHPTKDVPIKVGNP